MGLCKQKLDAPKRQNDKLTKTLARNHPFRGDFDEWVRIVGHVAQQLEVPDGRNRYLKQPVHSEFPRENFDKGKFIVLKASKQPLRSELPQMRNEYRRLDELDSSGDIQWVGSM